MYLQILNGNYRLIAKYKSSRSYCNGIACKDLAPVVVHGTIMGTSSLFLNNKQATVLYHCFRMVGGELDIIILRMFWTKSIDMENQYS